MEKPQTLDTNYTIPTTVKTLDGFTKLSEEELKQFINEYGLAMDLATSSSVRHTSVTLSNVIPPLPSCA